MGRRRRHHRCRFLPVGAVFGGLCCLMLVLARLPRRSMLYLLADSSLARLALAAGCHGGSVIVLLWRLYFVGILLGDASKSIARWCFHRYCHSPSWVPPLGWRRMAVCGAWMCCRCHHQLQRRLSCPAKLWFACPSRLLVSISLGGPSDGGRQWSGVATRSGAGMH